MACICLQERRAAGGFRRYCKEWIHVCVHNLMPMNACMCSHVVVSATLWAAGGHPDPNLTYAHELVDLMWKVQRPWMFV